MFEISTDVGKKVFTEFFRFLNLLWLWTSHMQVHGLIRLLAGAVLHETAATTFDLYSASGLLLDMFDVSTTLANDLSP